jgi:hypothetical protein
MWLQTWHPHHPLYAALQRHDFEAFAAQQLQERRQAGLPPFSHLALLRAEARTAQDAQAFVEAAGAAAAGLASAAAVTLYPAVPPPMSRVADVERMQMLLESPSRAALAARPAQLASRRAALGRGRGSFGDLKDGSALAGFQPGGRTPNHHTRPDRVTKAATVLAMMMRATRPLSAP